MACSLERACAAACVYAAPVLFAAQVCCQCAHTCQSCQLRCSSVCLASRSVCQGLCIALPVRATASKRTVCVMLVSAWRPKIVIPSSCFLLHSFCITHRVFLALHVALSFLPHAPTWAVLAAALHTGTQLLQTPVGAWGTKCIGRTVFGWKHC